MEDNKKPNKPADKPPVTNLEATYDIAALTVGAAAWKQFGYAPELVATALKLAGKETYTLPEAKAVVKTFAERPVK